jgi:hypothetical protein
VKMLLCIDLLKLKINLTFKNPFSYLTHTKKISAPSQNPKAHRNNHCLCKISTELINIYCGQNAEFLYVETGDM